MCIEEADEEEEEEEDEDTLVDVPAAGNGEAPRRERKEIEEQQIGRAHV